MDKKVKQRLIGAAVLTAVAVVALPPLVMRKAPESEVADMALDLPPAPQPPEAAEQPPPSVPTRPGAEGVLRMPQAGADAQTQAPDVASAPPPARAGGDFAVHFGAYASQADAQAVNAPLLAANLPGYVEQTTVGNRRAWQVRIGPYASRADAEAARLRASQIRNDVGARVVSLSAPPATAPLPTQPATAPAATPAAPTAVATVPEAPPAQAQASAPTPPAPTPAPALGTPPAPVAQTAPAAPQPAPQPAPVASPTRQAQTPPAQQSPAPRSAAPAAANIGFAVQLGAFSNREEAQQLRDRARAAGFSAITETVPSASGTLTRVRIGPVASRAEAESLQAQVSLRLGVSGQVRQHP